MSPSTASEFDVVRLPTQQQRKIDIVLVTSVALSFISFWRAAAIVLCDLASTAYYIGGISEQAIGKAAPWFILGVMLFSYAVRAVYVESCTMFTRGGVYRVVKEAMGGTLAKLSVSALMFDYILTGPISAVSAGQYLVGLIGNLLALLPGHNIQLNSDAHPELVKMFSMLLAVAITIYFWRTNIIGIGESSHKAMKIMKLTTVMGVIIVVWCGLTFVMRPETRHLPPIRPVLTAESSGWLANWPKIIGLFGIVIAFGHSLLAMSGEESLAQVNRELEAPKLPNLKKAGFVIFLYSLLLTSLISFFAVMIIPDAERIKTTVVDGNSRTEVISVVAQKTAAGSNQQVATKEDGTTFTVPKGAEVVRESGKYTDNLISGLAMHVVGPQGLKIALQGFVVFVGFLILSGAVNTSIVGSNGVLNRLAEDGVLTPWFLHPQEKFGTTHRLINIVAVLQLLTIVASMGDVYTLGEAYAFGVVWSFVFKTLAMVVLRFKDKSPRQYEVPLNIRIHRKETTGAQIDLPIGILAIFLILLGTALLNLMTKKVATVWGIGFTIAFLTVFVICEQISRRFRKGLHHEHLEQFNEKIAAAADAKTLGLTHPHPIIVAIRNPRSLATLAKLLHEIDTNVQDVVVVTCKVLAPLTQGITPEEVSVQQVDREVLTKVVTVAEEAGKRVHPLVIPTNNPLFAIASAARDLEAKEVILGTSEKVTGEVLVEQFALAWGMAMADHPGEQALTIRIVGPDRDEKFEL